MITEDVGKYYSQTQKKIEQLKQNVQQLHQTNQSQNDQNFQNICGNLYKNIENINGDVERKMDDLFYNMINNYNNTVQDLKEIKQVDQGSMTTGLTGRMKSSLFDSRSSSRDETNFDDRKFLQEFKKHSNTTGSYKPKHISQKLSNKTIKSKSSNKSLLPQVNEISYSESDMKEGLLGMLNKGKIPRGMPIDQVFNGKDNNLVLSRPAKIANFQESQQKRIVQSGRDVELTTFKLEPPNIDPSLPKIQKKQQYKPQEKRQKSTSSSINGLYNFLSIENTFKKKEQVVTQQKLTLEKIDPKTYPQVMDSYSLHHFLIRKGRVLEETPEFQSYQRTFSQDWPEISQCLRLLEKLMKDYQIQLATVDGKALGALASQTSQPTKEDLVQILVNQNEILKIIKIPKLMFQGPNGKDKAATKIQAAWKRLKTLREYQRLKVLIKKVLVIQDYFRLQLNKKSTKVDIKKVNEKNVDKFNLMKKQLIHDWPIKKLKKIVQIHINTFSYDELKRLTMEKISQRQNMQITRIFALRNPMVEIVYISPFDMSSEIINYYYKILELNGITDFRDRLHFIWPENHSVFPVHFSTSRVLLYSPKAIFRLKKLIKNKESLIIPGFPSNDDIKLACALNVPLFSGDPQTHLVCSTKSGAKRIFQAAEVPTPPGAFEIYDQKEFINTLAILIVNNLSVETWLLKIDDENLGRGIAYFNVNSLKYLRQIRKTYGEIEINNDFLQKITEILQQKLPQKLKIATPSLFPTYNSYLSSFLSKGGIIEASPAFPSQQISSPSIFMQIDPQGNVSVLGSFEKLQGPEYRNIGCQYPQNTLPNMNLELLSQAVGTQLYKKGVFGYITIDLIAFPDPQDGNNHPLFWAIGLDCFQNNFSSACSYFYFLVKGRCDPTSGGCILENDLLSKTNDDIQSEARSMLEKASNQSNERSFIYCPQLQHAALENLQYKTFFHLCRVESISFDLEKKIGSTFILIDSLQSGILGLMAIGENPAMAIKYMNDTLKFLTRHLGQANDKFQKTDICESRTDKIYLSDIQSKLKLMMRKYDRDYKKMQRPQSYKESIYI